MVGYFGLKFIYHGFVEYLGDEFLSVNVYLFIQSLDFLLLGGILLVFYARVWPPFFQVGGNELIGVSNFAIY